MSAIATGTTPAALNPKQEEILRYLHENAPSKTYFKSRLIGEAIGLSAKEVGTNMPAVVDAAQSLDIEKWGYSSSTTWKVTA